MKQDKLENENTAIEQNEEKENFQELENQFHNDDKTTQELEEDAQLEGPTEEEKEKTRKEQAFLERQRKKAERRAELELQNKNNTLNQTEKDELDELREAANYVRFQRALESDRYAFSSMEKEFAENISDYAQTKEFAQNALKKRLMARGMTEAQAASQIELDMLKLANMAHKNNMDPVEAVYKEAKQINQWIESIAEEMGYVKAKKPKTNVQALREASKPNAMTGGLGRSSRASKKSWQDLDTVEEVREVTLRELMNKG